MPVKSETPCRPRHDSPSEKDGLASRVRADSEVRAALECLGLPPEDSREAILDSMVADLGLEPLLRFDELEGDEQGRLDLIFGDPETALWLSAGFRLPLVRRQASWMLWVLRRLSLPSGFSVLDFGSGAGLTSAILARELGAQVHAFDPQAGSAVAVRATALRLGTHVDAFESPELAQSLGADVVLGQAVLWYLMQRPGSLLPQDLRGESDSLREFLDRCAEAKAAVVVDHARTDLWMGALEGLGRRGMRPDWDTAEMVTAALPLGDDRQLSLLFTHGQPDPADRARLEQVLAGEIDGVQRA